MNFCPNCEFMVYTKLSEDQTSLSKYCKNCSWDEDFSKPNEVILVNKNDYNKEYVSERYIINKYTVLDPTLPRINNIPCINSKCLTNLEVNPSSVIIENINVSKSDIINEYLIQNNIITDPIIIKPINSEKVLVELDEASFEKIQVLTNKPIILDSHEIIIKNYIKPEREILFIKYDKSNMKYLYLCACCLT